MTKLIINNISKLYILLYCINNRKMVFKAYVYGVQEQSNCKKLCNEILIFIFLRIELTKHPDITGWGKPTEVYGFWSHPFNRQFPFRSWKTHTTVYRLYLNVLPYQAIADIDSTLNKLYTKYKLFYFYSLSKCTLSPSYKMSHDINNWADQKHVLQTFSLRTINKSNMPSLSTRGRYFLILGAFQKDAHYLH